MAIGKIIKSISGFYYVLSGETLYQCKGRGIFRKRKVTPLVGDVVEFEESNQGEGSIHTIHDRKNELIRPPIANVDQAIIVTSAIQPEFNPLLLDRFLVLIESKNIQPLIIISKMDEVDDAHFQDIMDYREIYEAAGYPVVLSATNDQEGIERITSLLEGKITVIAGQSGVGKSSLLNVIDPRLSIETNEISTSLGRGKHTTRHVELYEVSGGFVADTPGFSSLDFDGLESEDLPSCFPEFEAVKHECKFRGCLHNKEPKCAVKDYVESGYIARRRYQHYLQFLEEIQTRKPRY
ncbi:ribosome small subunit-dependent GTPase A [Thalassobacillus sp. CUG 92003]|uniref:ribosome small subunit-dependent GTPase A n=1 Tax=Thalassobacillus sp. CUG 92003 TaxID=2736641 RepID=UPI0015E7D2F9|nr:ribosome small subunit-dependent GTPase A [Thalassobacillus sp. CUG 92003]